MVSINTLMLTLASLLFLYIGYSSLTITVPRIPETPRFLWGEATGKERSIQSKTGDASLRTELTRRQTIQGFGRVHPSKIKESRTSSGSYTGAIETFMISAICPCPPNPCPPSENYVYDGEVYKSEYCNILSGDGTAIYDGGYPTTEVCESCPEGPEIYDGGDAEDEFCNVLDDVGTKPFYDGGIYNTIVCGI